MRPRKRPSRTSASAASVPSTVATSPTSSAMRERGDAGREHGAVVEQRDVPARRPAAPHRDQPRCVERIDHQDHDRHVEEGEAERERGEVGAARAARIVSALPIARVCSCW